MYVNGFGCLTLDARFGWIEPSRPNFISVSRPSSVTLGPYPPASCAWSRSVTGVFTAMRISGAVWPDDAVEPETIAAAVAIMAAAMPALSKRRFFIRSLQSDDLAASTRGERETTLLLRVGRRQSTNVGPRGRQTLRCAGH